jgi:hypothetical protein
LRYRAAAVRTELLEIAALLERTDHADPECVGAIHRLVRDGSSPLYDPAVHVSELYSTLAYIRGKLTSHP